MTSRTGSLIRRAVRLGRASATLSTASFMEVERAERMFYLDLLREGMTVFDVGANVGELTLLFSRFVGKEGSVHSFEASSEVFQRLAILCRAAGCHNVTLNQIAIAEVEGSIVLNIYDEDHSSWNTRAKRPLNDYGIDVTAVGEENVSATTLDLYCERNNVTWIDLLKIDVEGAELQVLQGAHAMLKAKRIGCVSFEFGQTTFDMGNTPHQIESLLNDCGYRVRNIIEGNPVFPGRESVQRACYSMHVATP